MSLVLYSYWRSTAAYRVRIALNLKGIPHRIAPVHLVKDGGEQHGAAYRTKNPMGLVPALEVDGRTLTQSLAILDYLDERWPEPPLLPADPALRARAREIALTIACDIHPVNNLRVLSYLGKTLGADETARKAWYHHWLEVGFPALEAWADAEGPFLLGPEPCLADVCLVPQLFNAHRFEFPLDAFPRLRRAEEAARAHSAFAAAAPAAQPDAEG